MEEAPRRRRKPSRTRCHARGLTKQPSPTPTRPLRAVPLSDAPSLPGSDVEALTLSPSPGPGLTSVSASSEPSPQAARPPRWLILDRVGRRCRWRDEIVEGDATLSTTTRDCIDRPIRASLRLADAPAVSRLYLHCSGRRGVQSIAGMAEPAVIAAHRNSILFQADVPFKDPALWKYASCFPVDYFVYSCSSSSPPSLTRLPPFLKEGASSKPEFDGFFKPYRCHRQRTMLDHEMGLLCHGDDGEFTVADITHRFYHDFELCLLHHPPPGSDIQMQWRAKRLPIPPEMGLNLSSWRTDTVIPIGGRLCWVDHYQGMLLIDVVHTDSETSSDQQELHYIPLPSEALQWRRLYIDAFSTDPFRFDIFPGKWEKDIGTAMEASEFWGLCAAQCLPHVTPILPTVSMVDPDVVCFVLKDDRHISWMVEVNMRNKVLQSSALYISEQDEDEEGCPSEKKHRNSFDCHYFVPSKFSSYLSKDAITSKELSEILQNKAKQRVLQISRLEAQSNME
ncbi:hypothetical protein ACP70R_023078 [Stipagrostis hirtigluma subsp. patula]